jgi:DNA repair protein RadC
LNRANTIIEIRPISKGGLSGTVVDPKMIFHEALQARASGIILSHNHPSTNPKPSESDMQLTKKLKEGGKLLEISILDHIIIAGASFYSFADEGNI